MKFDNYTGIVTNSSSMLYVITSRDAARRARRLLAEHGIRLEYSRNKRSYKRLFNTGWKALGDMFADKGVPGFSLNNTPFPSASASEDGIDEWFRLYQEGLDSTKKSVRRAMRKVSPFWFFVPERSSNSMTMDEMELYESISDRSTQLS